MPVEHIVLFEPNSDATDEQMNEVMNKASEFKDRIPGVVDVKAGKNFTDRAGNYAWWRC